MSTRESEGIAATLCEREETRVAEVDEVPPTYLPSNAARIRVKAIGPLREAGS